MTAIGELNRRLVLEAPVETPDGAGGVNLSFTPVATLWASLAPTADRADARADAPGAVVAHRIVIRTRADITTRHRFRLGSRIFRIVAVREHTPGFLSIHAEERIE